MNYATGRKLLGMIVYFLGNVSYIRLYNLMVVVFFYFNKLIQNLKLFIVIVANDSLDLPC